MEIPSGSSDTQPSPKRPSESWNMAFGWMAASVVFFGGAALVGTDPQPSSSPADTVSPLAECRRKLAENLGHVFASERAFYGNHPPSGQGQTVEVAARVGNISCHARLALDETLTNGDSDVMPEGGE